MECVEKVETCPPKHVSNIQIFKYSNILKRDDSGMRGKGGARSSKTFSSRCSCSGWPGPQNYQKLKIIMKLKRQEKIKTKKASGPHNHRHPSPTLILQVVRGLLRGRLEFHQTYIPEPLERSLREWVAVFYSENG